MYHQKAIQLEVQVPHSFRYLVFAEQEWTKSFTTGGFAYVGQADNDD